MRNILGKLVVLSLLFFAIPLSVSCSDESVLTKKRAPIIRHMVLFKFKEDAARQDIDDAFKTLMDLKDKIPGIVSITTGHYESHEKLNKGFNYGFTIDFKDASASERYHSHPERQKVKAKFIKLLDGGLDGVIAGELVVLPSTNKSDGEV